MTDPSYLQLPLVKTPLKGLASHATHWLCQGPPFMPKEVVGVIDEAANMLVVVIICAVDDGDMGISTDVVGALRA
jgi:hypothetical protein